MRTACVVHLGRGVPLIHVKAISISRIVLHTESSLAVIISSHPRSSSSRRIEPRPVYKISTPACFHVQTIYLFFISCLIIVIINIIVVVVAIIIIISFLSCVGSRDVCMHIKTTSDSIQQERRLVTSSSFNHQ